MHRRLRHPIVLVPIAIVVTIVAVWWLAFRPEEEATASSTTTKLLVEVTSGPMSETVSAEGTVAAAQTDDLSFSASGTVTAVNVKAGDAVTAGQALATIDSAELESAVAAAEAKVATAEAQLSDDESAGASDAQITADEASLTSAEDQLADADEALAGAALVATFDGTVASVGITVGEELGSSGSNGTSSTGSNSGSDQSSANLGSSGPSLPNAAASDSDTESSAQIQVVSAGRFTVELGVDSADIDRVAVGQTATVTRSTSSAASGPFPGGLGGLFGGGAGGPGGAQPPTSDQGGGTDDGADDPGGVGATPGGGTADGTEATGTVTEVGQIADASSGVATYAVTISFDASGDDFYVGSTVTGGIATDTRDNVVQVSSAAVTTTNGVSTVTVATDGTTTGPTESRTVTTGLVANGSTEITSGLRAGEQVIVTITRPGGTNGFSPPAGGGPGNFPGGPPGAVTNPEG